MTSTHPVKRGAGAVMGLTAALAIALAAGGFFFGRSYTSSGLRDLGADPSAYADRVNLSGILAGAIGLIVGVFLLSLAGAITGRRDRKAARVIALIMGFVILAAAIWLAFWIFPELADPAKIIEAG